MLKHLVFICLWMVPVCSAGSFPDVRYDTFETQLEQVARLLRESGDLKPLAGVFTSLHEDASFVEDTLIYWEKGGLFFRPQVREAIRQIMKFCSTPAHFTNVASALEDTGLTSLWLKLGFTYQGHKDAEAHNRLVAAAQAGHAYFNASQVQSDILLDGNELLRKRSDHTERRLFFAHLALTTVLLGTVGYVASDYINWAKYPIEKLLGFGVVGANWSYYGGLWLWRVVREPYFRLKFRKQRREMVDAIVMLMQKNPEQTIEVLTSVFQTQPDARIEFMEHVVIEAFSNVPGDLAARALVDFALKSEERGNTALAEWCFNILEKQKALPDLPALRKHVERARVAQKNYSRKIARIRIWYMGKRFGVAAGAVTGFAAGINHFYPEQVTSMTVLVSNILTLFFVRPFLLSRFTSLSKELVEEPTAKEKAEFIDALRTLIRVRPRMRDFVEALTTPIHSPHIIEAAREALRLESASDLLKTSGKDIRNRHPTEVVRANLVVLYTQNHACLDEFVNWEIASKPLE